MAIAEAPQTSQRQDEVLEYSIIGEFPSWKLIPLWVILAEAAVKALLTTDWSQTFSLQVLPYSVNQIFLDSLILSSIPGIWSWISGSSHRQRQKINSILGTEWELSAPFSTKSPNRFGIGSETERLLLGGMLIWAVSMSISSGFGLNSPLPNLVLLLITCLMVQAWGQWRQEKLYVVDSGLLWERPLTTCFIRWSAIETVSWRRGSMQSRLFLKMVSFNGKKSESWEIGFPLISDAEQDRLFDLLKQHAPLKRQ